MEKETSEGETNKQTEKKMSLKKIIAGTTGKIR
jgi:hypothetical protein